MNPYARGRLGRRMGRNVGDMPDISGLSVDLRQWLHGWCDEDDTLRTGVDSIQAAYVADMLAARRAADELRFADWVRSQRVAG